MTQLTLRDAAASAALKEVGQNAIEQTDQGFVALMRQYARVIAENSGFVSIDNLRIVAENLGVVPTHQNSWGAVFRGPHWKIVGRQKSALPSNHHREIRVWEWVP